VKLTFRTSDDFNDENGNHEITVEAPTVLSGLGLIDSQLFEKFGATLADDTAIDLNDLLECLSKGTTYKRREISEMENNFDLVPHL
jgi:hypothetical protein